VTEVRWTRRLTIFQAIYDFIGRDSKQYAQVIIEGILAAIDNLEQFPLLGRTVPERSPDNLRELIKPPYRIVYRVTEAIYIRTIFRTSRIFPSNLE
jgi:toxin ParE1/3/4